MKLRGDRNQCPSCSAYFNSTSAFEKHRIGRFGIDRRCLSVDEMQARGMVLRADGFWRGSERLEGPHRNVTDNGRAHAR